jgi:hypothetical protein
MFRTKIAAVAIAAVAVIGTGAALGGTASATTNTTTNFTFPSISSWSPTLYVDSGNAVPANGTAVTFDLQNFVSNASLVQNGNVGDSVADTGTILADDVESATLGLGSTSYAIHTAFGTSTGTEVSGAGIPSSDFSNLPTEVIPSTGSPAEKDPVTNTTVSFSPALADNYNLPDSDTTVTLYVEGATATTFEVSGTNGGTPLSFYDVAAIDPSLASYVTWGQAVVVNPTPPVTPPPVGHSHNPVPVLSDGAAVWVSPVREDVTFNQNIASWDEFTIHGPGPINGQHGWVDAVAGTNAAIYGGLNGKSGYTVTYQPVTGQGSTTPIHGSHHGYVWFTTSNTQPVV